MLQAQERLALPVSLARAGSWFRGALLMTRIIRRHLGAVVALALLATVLGGCVVYDERPYHRYNYEAPHYYGGGYWGHYR
jgi:hypothetical protein